MSQQGWTIRLAALAAAALAGCTPAQYARQADRDAYHTLREGWRFSLGSDPSFDVAYKPYAPPKDQPDGSIRVGDRAVPLRGEKVIKLTLDDCLQIALRNSRSYQTRKEELYATALALANSRRGWDLPLLSGTLSGQASRTRQERGDVVNSGAFLASPTLTQRLVYGTELTLGLAVDLASDLLGWRSTTVGSLLNANVTQPLLRGAWRGLAYEQQYRAERDFLFSVLTYERFTQEFAVDILSRYYAVLQQRDELENERANIERLKETFALTQTLVRGGLRSRIEEDQAEQQLLNARVRFEVSQQSYQDALDRLKVALGLPVKARMEPAYPEALDELNRIGPKPVPIEESDALTVAMLTRPDVLSRRAALRDAARDVEIATHAFLPQLDVTLDISAAGTPPRKPERVQFHRHTRSAGVTFNYELDQTANRDAYWLSLITLDQTRRDYEQFVDELQLEIRRSYRSLAQSRRSYELQLRNVTLAKRRRKLAVLQQKEGQAAARDVLDAENDLRGAQNGLTAALVTYTTTRLRFLTALGLIRVDEKGTLHERPEPLKFDRIGGRYPYAVGR